MSWRVGVDVGGTFTDLVATDDSGAIVRFKVATTPKAPEEGLLDALRTLLEHVKAAEIVQLTHASTIATNALLGQVHLDLPRVAFVTTEGFRDVLEIGRQARSSVYDLNVKRPTPLALREDRLTVRERIDYDGSVHRRARRCERRERRSRRSANARSAASPSVCSTAIRTTRTNARSSTRSAPRCPTSR